MGGAGRPWTEQDGTGRKDGHSTLTQPLFQVRWDCLERREHAPYVVVRAAGPSAERGYLVRAASQARGGGPKLESVEFAASGI